MADYIDVAAAWVAPETDNLKASVSVAIVTLINEILTSGSSSDLSVAWAWSTLEVLQAETDKILMLVMVDEETVTVEEMQNYTDEKIQVRVNAISSGLIKVFTFNNRDIESTRRRAVT